VDFPVILEVVGHLPDGGPFSRVEPSPFRANNRGEGVPGGRFMLQLFGEEQVSVGTSAPKTKTPFLNRSKSALYLMRGFTSTPNLRLCVPCPLTIVVKSSRNCRRSCCTPWGVEAFWPTTTDGNRRLIPKLVGFSSLMKRLKWRVNWLTVVGGNHPGVHPLPGDVLVGGNLEGAVGGRATNRNIRVNAQAFAGSVALESSAEAEGMVAIEMMVEAAHHQQIAEWRWERAFKLREDPRGVHGLGLFLTVAFNGEEPKRLVLNDRGAETSRRTVGG